MVSIMALTLPLVAASVPSADNFCKQLDQDQDRQNVGPDLDPIRLILLWYSSNNILKMLILKKKSQQMTTKHEKLPGVQGIKYFSHHVTQMDKT